MDRNTLTKAIVKSYSLEGQTVFLKVMSGRDYSSWQLWMKNAEESTEVFGDKDTFAAMLVRTICDEKGNRLFRDDETDAVKDIPATIYYPLFSHAFELNAFSKAAKEELKKNAPTRMWQLIAERLRCTVDEAYERVDAKQYKAYEVEYESHPWGQEIDDLRLSHNISWNAAAHGSSVKANDCLLRWTPEPIDNRESVVQKAKRIFRKAN